MTLSMLRPVVTLVLLSVAAPVFAQDRTDRVAPSAAVAAAWAAEAGPRPPTSKTLKALYGSYGVFQTLDMASTISARNSGAREVNPVLNSGYGGAIATKALLAAATLGAARLVEKKSRKAALVTMIALNVATAAVVMNNVHNAHQLNQR